jgi:glycosyltransferase involved in cell wall biosynthesis
VVHEFAAAGFPMILSDQVGAGESFLEDGVNGYSFSWQKEGDLEKKLQQIMNLPKEQLLEMGRKSHQFAQRITPELWTNTLLEIIEESADVRN